MTRQESRVTKVGSECRPRGHGTEPAGQAGEGQSQTSASLGLLPAPHPAPGGAFPG